MGTHHAVLEFAELYHWRYVTSAAFVKAVAGVDCALVQTWLNRVNVAAGAGFGVVNRMVVSLSLKIKDETGGSPPHVSAREGFKSYSTN